MVRHSSDDRSEPLCRADLVLAAPKQYRDSSTQESFLVTRRAQESVWSLLPMMSDRGNPEGIGLECHQRRWQHGDPLVGLRREHIAAGIRESGDRRDDCENSQPVQPMTIEHIVRESIAAFQQWRLVPAPKRGELSSG